MHKLSEGVGRRGFVKLMAAAPFVPQVFAGEGRRLWAVSGSDEVGKRLPGWKSGELELHFIHTGRGENMFYIFPDGTTMVNDTGDFYRPNEIANMPWMPRSDLLGGECVARYIKSVWEREHLDYMLLSHWHTDHMGKPSLKARATPDGRKVCGLALLGEEFTVGKFFDHQYPRRGQYGSHEQDGMDMVLEFLKAKEVVQEEFRPGALNQLALVHDQGGKYRESFSIRNVCSNAVCWTGKGEESIDHGAVHAKATGKEHIGNQNTLSMGFVVQYGSFRFWSGGDLSGGLVNADGVMFDFESYVGQFIGPVTVCKTNHHSYKDAMPAKFVAAVQAAAYVTLVWCPHHIQDCNMRSISSEELYPGERMVFPTYVPERPKKEWPDAPWWKNVGPGGHVVVKVQPGGQNYKIYLLDATDELLNVKAVWAGRA